MMGNISATVRRWGIAAGVGLLAAGLMTTPASAATPRAAVSAPAPGANARALAHWTVARMAAAKPAPLGVVADRKTTQAATDPIGAPVAIAPAKGSVADPNVIEPLATTAVARPYTNVPDRLNGKLFFTDGFFDYVCSGTVVNGTNKDLVDTAGHCVSDGAGTFYYDFVFVPGYSSKATGCGAGCYPYGLWTYRFVTTPDIYHTTGNKKQDLAYVVLNPLNGQHIVDRIGGQGSLFNQARNQGYNAFGYPSAAPSNGYDQKRCNSGRLADDNPGAGPGPLTIRITCDMTEGSSGGGWLIKLASGLGYVNSHVSYRYVGGPLANPNHLYGPYYGTEALDLFTYAQTL